MQAILSGEHPFSSAWFTLAFQVSRVATTFVLRRNIALLQAMCSGIEPPLSGWFTSAFASSSFTTMSARLSLMAQCRGVWPFWSRWCTSAFAASSVTTTSKFPKQHATFSAVPSNDDLGSSTLAPSAIRVRTSLLRPRMAAVMSRV